MGRAASHPFIIPPVQTSATPSGGSEHLAPQQSGQSAPFLVDSLLTSTQVASIQLARAKRCGPSGRPATLQLHLQVNRRKQPPSPRRPSAQEIYDDLKIKDELLSGSYANAVMIGHGPHEFSFDFITNFFPNSAVSARVFLSAGQVPRFSTTASKAHGINCATASSHRRATRQDQQTFAVKYARASVKQSPLYGTR